jgi:plastocyanin
MTQADAAEAQPTDRGGTCRSHTFDVPDIYRYVCSLHGTSGMKGNNHR